MQLSESIPVLQAHCRHAPQEALLAVSLFLLKVWRRPEE